MMAKLEFISAQLAHHAVRRLCAVLGVARSWFYAWRAGAERRTLRESEDVELATMIASVFETSKRCYGAPRIHAELRAQGWRLSKRRIAGLMREHGLRPERRKRKPPITTHSRHSSAVAPNLLGRNFDQARPDAVRLADISYVPTGEGWLFLAAIKDMATREIVGWSMSDRLNSSLCENALEMAIRRRRPLPGLIHHSDRGVQYACGDYRNILSRHGIKASMSRKGCCLANAPMESFFGSLKSELVHRTRFRTRAEAKAALFEYIEIFYNRRRVHSSIGYRTPVRARQAMMLHRAA